MRAKNESCGELLIKYGEQNEREIMNCMLFCSRIE